MKHPHLVAAIIFTAAILTAAVLYSPAKPAVIQLTQPIVRVIDKPAPEQPKIDLPGDKDDLVEIGQVGKGAVLTLDKTSLRLSDINIASFFVVVLVAGTETEDGFAVVEKVQINCNDRTATVTESTAISPDGNVLEHKEMEEKWLPINPSSGGKTSAMAVIQSIVCPKMPKGHIYTI